MFTLLLILIFPLPVLFVFCGWSRFYFLPFGRFKKKKKKKKTCIDCNLTKRQHTRTSSWCTSKVLWIAMEVFCLFPSELTSSKHGTKRQSQSIKIINEKWNAFYSFLITRIVAHNWASVSELRLLHTCVGLSAGVYALIRLCVCVRARWSAWQTRKQMEWENDRHTKRRW